MKKWIGIAVVVLILGGIGFAIAQRANETIEQRKTQVAAVQPPPAVELETATTRVFQPRVRATGELVPLREVKVYPKVAGTILTIGPDLGARVKANDTLATLDAEQVEAQRTVSSAQRRAASTAVSQARVQRDAAKTELERAKTLYAKQALARSELDRAQAAYDSAVAAINAASAQVGVASSSEKVAGLSVEWLTVTSPIDGVVTRRLVDVGAQVSPSTPMYEIQDNSQLELVVSVPPAASSVLAIDDRATFTVDGLPGRTFEGRIAALSPTLDPATRRFRVKIRADGGQPGLMAHMFAAAFLPIGEAQERVAVPREALVDTEHGPSAFLVIDGKAKRVGIDLALEQDGFVPVEAGVAAGARVVVRGQSVVRDGAEVNVVEPPAEGAKASDEAAPVERAAAGEDGR